MNSIDSSTMAWSGVMCIWYRDAFATWIPWWRFGRPHDGAAPVCDAPDMIVDDLVVFSPLFGLVSCSIHGLFLRTPIGRKLGCSVAWSECLCPSLLPAVNRNLLAAYHAPWLDVAVEGSSGRGSHPHPVLPIRLGSPGTGSVLSGGTIVSTGLSWVTSGRLLPPPLH